MLMNPVHHKHKNMCTELHWTDVLYFHGWDSAELHFSAGLKALVLHFSCRHSNKLQWFFSSKKREALYRLNCFSAYLWLVSRYTVLHSYVFIDTTKYVKFRPCCPVGNRPFLCLVTTLHNTGLYQTPTLHCKKYFNLLQFTAFSDIWFIGFWLRIRIAKCQPFPVCCLIPCPHNHAFSPQTQRDILSRPEPALSPGAGSLSPRVPTINCLSWTVQCTLLDLEIKFYNISTRTLIL